MQRALLISHQALSACLPNPPVGCVLVHNNEIIAQGFTQACGGTHAQPMALACDYRDLSNAVAYVTLAPCSFAGRTPSCAKALIEAGIQQVVVAMTDPDPRNNGKGIAMLRAQGIRVDVGEGKEEVAKLRLPYLDKS